jgi:hypothetical protein
MICERMLEIDPVPAGTKGCEECLKTGMHWVHLRLCSSRDRRHAAGR